MYQTSRSDRVFILISRGGSKTLFCFIFNRIVSRSPNSFADTNRRVISSLNLTPSAEPSSCGEVFADGIMEVGSFPVVSSAPSLSFVLSSGSSEG